MKPMVKETNKAATYEPAIYLSNVDEHDNVPVQGKLVRLREPAGPTCQSPLQLPPPSSGQLTPAILRTFWGCDALGEKEAENIIAMLARFSAVLYQTMAS